VEKWEREVEEEGEGVRQARREEARKLPRAAVGLISDRVG